MLASRKKQAYQGKADRTLIMRLSRVIYRSGSMSACGVSGGGGR
jgi:hypothetical protein